MAEPASEAAGFAQDLFSPLQFCEVVQEGQGGHHHVKDDPPRPQNPQLTPHSSAPVTTMVTIQGVTTTVPSSTATQHLHLQAQTSMAHMVQQHQQHVQQHQHQQHVQQQQTITQNQLLQQQLNVQQQQQAQSMAQQQLMQQHQQQQVQQQAQVQQQVQQQAQVQQQVQQQAQVQQQVQQAQQQAQQQVQQQAQQQVQQQAQQQQQVSLVQQTQQQAQQQTTQQLLQPQQQAPKTPMQQQQQQGPPQVQQHQTPVPPQGVQQVQLPLAAVGNVQLVNGVQMPTITVHSTATKATSVAVAPNNTTEGPPVFVITGIVTTSEGITVPATTAVVQSTPVPTTTTTTTTNTTLVNGTSNREQVKPVPVKRTWRRPWKKKKEREKRQPVKKARRVKRKRVMVPKKSVIHIDPRNGPSIDTSLTQIKRESEEAINQLKQKRQRIKLNRNSGREYVNRLGKVVGARIIGSPCNCPLKCWERMGSKILEIFNNFWDLSDFNLQNSYLFTCLKLCDVKRRYTKKVNPAEESRRQNTFEYFVRISGKHLRVCKRAFMSSHGLTSDKRLRTLFHQMKDGALVPEPDRRGKHLRPAKSPSQMSPAEQIEHCQATKVKKPRMVKKKQNKPENKPMYTPPPPPMGHMHPAHCTPPPPPAHSTAMQEPPHAYIPNGEIYFPGHYLEPHQSMAPPPINQIPSCQKMLEAPAYFMAGMKENTFHQ